MWPVRYTLRFVPDPLTSVLAGHMVVQIEVDPLAGPLTSITLHTLHITILNDSVIVRPSPLDNISSTDAAETNRDDAPAAGPSTLCKLVQIKPLEAEEAVELIFDSPLPQSSFELSMSYLAHIGDKKVGAGCFRCNEARDRNFLVTHLEPVNARRLYPCFDEPWFKAYFRIIVDFDARYTVLSCTMPESEEMQDALLSPAAVAGTSSSGRSASANGTASVGTSPPCSTSDPSVPDVLSQSGGSDMAVRRTTFQWTKSRISPYLVAFATGKFQTLEGHTKASGLLCRVSFPVDYKLTQGWFALDLLTKAVDFFEEFFGYPLPLEKLDIIGIVDFPVLGMENYGLMCFLKDYLLVDEQTLIEKTQRIARLVGHEVAHQWYGNTISVDWWTQLWLKEGFCRYLEFLFVSNFFPQWQMWGEFVTMVLDEALQVDCRPERSHPIENACVEPRKIFDNFDVISYGKGASTLRMLAAVVGEDQLVSAMRHLVREKAGTTFNTEDFVASLIASRGPSKQISPLDVKELISYWVTNQDHPLVVVRTESILPSQEEGRDTTFFGEGPNASSGDDDGPNGSNNPTTIVQQQSGIATVTKKHVLYQYYMPDPTVGLLRTLSETGNSSVSPRRVDFPQLSNQTPRLKSYSSNYSDVLTPSCYPIPMRILVIGLGTTSVNKMHAFSTPSYDVPIATNDELYLFNSGATGVFRVDYETNLWLRIFSVTPYLSPIDRLTLSVTLFRLRTLHVGRWENNPEEPAQDRCTILLEWLVQLIAHGTTLSGTLWRFLAENLEPILFLVKDHHCWNIFADFICAFYHGLVQAQTVSFHSKETTVAYDAKVHISLQTVNTILFSLAVCKCKYLASEAAEFTDFALSTVIEGVQSPQALQPFGTFVPASDELGQKAVVAFQYVAEMNDATRWWQLVSILAHCLNLDLARFKDGLGMNLIPVASSAAAVEAILKEASSAASPSSAAAGPSFAPASSSPNTVLRGDLILLDRIRWINLVAPAVLCYEDVAAHSLLVAILNSFTGVTSALAKAVVRNTKLFWHVLEVDGGAPAGSAFANSPPPGSSLLPRISSAVIRNSLLQHAMTLCSNSNILNQMRMAYAGNGSMAVARALEKIELNCIWADYIKDHYQRYLLEKQRDGLWNTGLGSASGGGGNGGDNALAESDPTGKEPGQISI